VGLRGVGVMKYFTIFADGGYLLSVNLGNNIPMNGAKITDEEYNDILAVIDAKPTPPVGYEYYLKPDMTWELLELPPVPEEPIEEPAAE